MFVGVQVKHAMMQLYVLKLLKMQTKYLGRQWRKTNMKTMSAIYQKVRTSHAYLKVLIYGVFLVMMTPCSHHLRVYC